MIDKLNIGQKFIITYRPNTHNGEARPKLKNGKDTRQVVMKDGARPHAHLLRDDDTLRNMTQIELGALHKKDRYEHVKLIGI